MCVVCIMYVLLIEYKQVIVITGKKVRCSPEINILWGQKEEMILYISYILCSTKFDSIIIDYNIEQ